MAQIRPMAPSDAEGVGAMHHDSWRDTYGEVLPVGHWERWTEADSVALWRRSLQEEKQPGVCRLVAVEEDSIVGFVVSGPTRAVGDRPEAVRALELWGLYVARPQLGSGLGQGLLDAAIAPGSPAELWVFWDNARARSFYRRNGFAPDGAVFVDDRFPELPEIRMVR